MTKKLPLTAIALLLIPALLVISCKEDETPYPNPYIGFKWYSVFGNDTCILELPTAEDVVLSFKRDTLGSFCAKYSSRYRKLIFQDFSMKHDSVIYKFTHARHNGTRYFFLHGDSLDTICDKNYSPWYKELYHIIP